MRGIIFSAVAGALPDVVTVKNAASGAKCVTPSAGTAAKSGSTSFALADVDGDGDLDLYVTNYRTTTLRDEPFTKFTINMVNGKPVLTAVNGLVEKPAPGTAPSNLSVIGRYILQPEVMRVLENQEKGAGGEIQLTDAMARMIGTQPFHGLTFDGRRYDCGDKAGYIHANLALALEREDIGATVRAFAQELLR